LVEEQGLLGLVEEEEGMVGLVEEEEGFIRVVCPNAQSEINERAAVATKTARMFTRLWKRSLSGRCFHTPIPPFIIRRSSLPVAWTVSDGPLPPAAPNDV
jgi:hypothetical protein